MKLHNISNDQFLQALFGDKFRSSHVTAFLDDPSEITQARSAACWAGQHYKAGMLPKLQNQYFCISLFNPSPDGRERRKKDLYSRCYVFVLDDVAEKIGVEEALKLPQPTYKLQTSAGSEQWGYKLAGNYTLAQISNAQDGLISSDLVPSGTDPGMRGVTRYVRLPEGGNSKASRIMWDGSPFDCHITEWSPEATCTLEDLVKPFDVDLNATRHESTYGDQIDVDNHPLLEIINVKEQIAPGEFEVTCPWIHTHTNNDDSGSRLWTFAGGKAVVHCHHGHCEEHGGRDLMEWARDQPGWTAAWEKFTTDQAIAQAGIWEAALNAQPVTPAPVAVDFIGGAPPVDFIGRPVVLEPPPMGIPPTAPEGMLSGVPIQPEWGRALDIVQNVVVLTSGNGGFYNAQSHEYIGSDNTLNNAYAHLTDEELPAKFIRDRFDKMTAAGIGWHPTSQKFIELAGRKLVNTYRPPSVIPLESLELIGDWLQLCNYIYGQHADLFLDHLAFTIQQPQTKIRWQFLTVGAPRTGKTMSIMPMVKIMGGAAGVVSQDSADAGWGDVFAKKKVIVFEEVFNNDKRHFNRLKSKLSNDEIENLNIKGRGILEQMNLYSIYLFTNHDDALQFDADQDKLLVIRAPTERMGEEFYANLGRKIDGSAAFVAAAYDFLLKRDVSMFKYGALPHRTEAMYQMCKDSRNEAVTALLSAMKHGELPFKSGVAEMATVKRWLADNKYRLTSDREISRVLTEGGWIKVQGKRKIEGRLISQRFWMPEAAAGAGRARDLYDYYLKAVGGIWPDS